MARHKAETNDVSHMWPLQHILMIFGLTLDLFLNLI